jgi:hypothetical protein
MERDEDKDRPEEAKEGNRLGIIPSRFSNVNGGRVAGRSNGSRVLFFRLLGLEPGEGPARRGRGLVLLLGGHAGNGGREK